MKQHHSRLCRGLCAVLCLLFTASILPFSLAENAAPKIVRVAYVLSPGYQEGGEGEYKTGYGYEYLQRIAEITGWEYTYVYGSFSDLLDMLKNGEVDLMGNLSYTEERAQSIAYGDCEQGRETYYLYVNNNTNTIDSIDVSSINGKKIGVSAGTMQEEIWKDWCVAQGITCEIVEYETATDRKAALNSGEVDATIGGAVQQDETTADWRVILNFGSSPFYFGVNKNRPDLLGELNSAQMQLLSENPFYNEEVHDLYMRSLALSTTTYSDAEKAWLGAHDGCVKFGYLTNAQPLSYIDEGGNFNGVAADVLTAMAAQYAADGLHFDPIPFKSYDEMLAALKDGEIDAAWPVYNDFWNADQNRISLTDRLMMSSMMLVYDGEYKDNTLSKIGIVTNGALSGMYAKIHYPDSEIREYATHEDAVSAVLRGEVTSMLYVTVIYNVDVERNDSLKALTAYLLPKTFGISIATARGNPEVNAILNKGIAVIGEDSVDLSLIEHSSVHKTVSLMDYFKENPLVANIAIGMVLVVFAGILLLIVYSKMRLRIQTEKAEKDTFETLSNSDLLTGLYNRKAVFKKCRALLSEHPNERFAMVHTDLRNFRLYNTFFGDDAGDKLLCDLADLSRNFSKEYSHIAYGRIEADVFCAFFPYDEEKYEKHLAELMDYFRNYRTDFLVEFKMGVYLVTDPSMPTEAMFTRATLAAEEVEAGSDHPSVIYDEGMEKALMEKQRIVNEMRGAIETEQFHVYLQPKYSLRSNRMVGAEALVRWIHPTRGIISPGIFVPIFESNSFITELDRYMWEHVCRLLAKWQEEGKPLLPVSVNISRLSMYGASTVDFLKSLVKKYGIAPKYLELELTESAYMDNPDEMKQQLHALREAGFVILLDDFGSGYSSLNTLRELPVDIVKLDMKFLSAEKKDTRGELVLSSIVRMTKLLNLPVIAEGVETQEQANFLKSIGCEFVQGYLYARPMTVANYEERLATASAPQINVQQPALKHIGAIIAETEAATDAVCSAIPAPIACLEYKDGSFFFLRCNPEFTTAFGLDDDTKAASVLFTECLTPQSLEDFKRAIEEGVRSGGKVQTVLTWNGKDGITKTFLCRAACEGSIGSTAVLMAAFMPE